jgi:hypothetical protein
VVETRKKGRAERSRETSDKSSFTARCRTRGSDESSEAHRTSLIAVCAVAEDVYETRVAPDPFRSNVDPGSPPNGTGKIAGRLVEVAESESYFFANCEVDGRVGCESTMISEAKYAIRATLERAFDILSNVGCKHVRSWFRHAGLVIYLDCKPSGEGKLSRCDGNMSHSKGDT